MPIFGFSLAANPSGKRTISFGSSYLLCFGAAVNRIFVVAEAGAGRWILAACARVEGDFY